MPRAIAAHLILAGLVAAAGAADVARLRFVTAIYVDDKGQGMRQPEGVACRDDAALIVGDTGHGRLLRYALEGGGVRAAGEIRAPQVTAPIRLQITSTGEVLVLDGKERRIARFDARGEFAGYLRPEGVPGSSSIVPRAFAVDGRDRLHVLDVFSARVLVLDARGAFERQLAFPEGYGFFSDLAVDGRGAVYLLDSLKAALYVARDAQGFTPLVEDLRRHLSFPTSLAIDSRGVLYVVDQSGGAVVLVAQDGSVLGRQLAMGWTEGLLYYPSQLCLTGQGQVFIADRGNNRVQVFALQR